MVSIIVDFREKNLGAVTQDVDALVNKFRELKKTADEIGTSNLSKVLLEQARAAKEASKATAAQARAESERQRTQRAALNSTKEAIKLDTQRARTQTEIAKSSRELVKTTRQLQKALAEKSANTLLRSLAEIVETSEDVESIAARLRTAFNFSDAKANALAQDLSQLGKEGQNTRRIAQQLQNAFNLDPSEAQALTSQLRRLETQAKRTSRSGKSLTDTITAWGVAIKSAAIDLAVEAIRGLASASREFVRDALAANQASRGFATGLEAALGSAEAASSELEFVRRTVDEFGGQVRSATQQYTGLSAAANQAGIDQRVVRDVFTETSRVLGVFNKSGEESDRVLQALSQIAGKGVVSMEELRQQLGEALPVAFGATAKGLGITTAELNELVASGELTAAEFFPAFARGLQTIEGEINPTRKALGQLKNQVFDLQVGIGRALEPIQAGVAGFASDLLEATGEDVSLDPLAESGERLKAALMENPELVERLAEALAKVASEGVEQLSLIIDAITALLNNEDSVEDFAQSIEGIVVVLRTLGQATRFLIGLTEAATSLRERASELPIVGDNIAESMRSPIPVITLLKNAVEDVISLFSTINQRATELRNHLTGVREEAIALEETNTGSGLADGLTEATESLGNALDNIDTQPVSNLGEQAETAEQRIKRLEKEFEEAESTATKTAAAREQSILQLEQSLRSQGKTETEIARQVAAEKLVIEEQNIRDQIRLQKDRAAAFGEGTDEQRDALIEVAELENELLQNQIDTEMQFRDDQIAAIEEASEAQQNATDIAIDGADAQLEGFKRIEQSLERQAELLEQQSGLQEAIADLRSASSEKDTELASDALGLARQRSENEERLNEIRKELRGTDDEEKRVELERERKELIAEQRQIRGEIDRLGFEGQSEAQIAAELVARTRERFELERQQQEQRQRLERLGLEFELQKNELTAQRVVTEERIALARLIGQRQALQAEIEIARVRGDDQAVRQGQAALGILDLQIDGQQQLVQLAEQNVEAEEKSAEAERAKLEALQQQEDIALAQQQEDTARSLDQDVQTGASARLSSDAARRAEQEEAEGEALANNLESLVLSNNELDRLVDGAAAATDQTVQLANEAERYLSALQRAEQSVPGQIPGFKTGGVTPGGAAIVGEVGPEPVFFPKGTRVVSNAQARRWVQESATANPAKFSSFMRSPIMPSAARSTGSVKAVGGDKELIKAMQALGHKLDKFQGGYVHNGPQTNRMTMSKGLVKEALKEMTEELSHQVTTDLKKKFNLS